MRASDVLSRNPWSNVNTTGRCVDANTPVLDVLPLLLEADDRRLAVTLNNNIIGIIDSDSLLEGLGNLLSNRDDSSIIVINAAPAQYSASAIAHAVEDADAHLVDLISHPDGDNKIRVTLRVRLSDPSAAIRSLERYGFDVIEASGPHYADAEVAEERLKALQVFLNV